MAAGQTVDLGRFDVGPYLAALQQAVTDAGETRKDRRSVVSYVGVAPPARIGPDPQLIAGAGTLQVSRAMVASGVVPATYTPATFQLGTDFLGSGGFGHIGGGTCFGANPGMDVSLAH